MKNITIGIVDDHQLFLKSLGLMLMSFNNYEVIVEALNGKELEEKLCTKNTSPDIMLIDVDMPVKNGVQTATWMQEHHPTTKLVALSMNNEDKTIIDMVKAGCCAYLLKDTHPNELETALNEIYIKGYYNADSVNINYRRLILVDQKKENFNISDKERIFLQYACSDMTYKQIADLMHVAERTVDGYRENLFQKLQVKSRVGLAMEAVRRGIASL